VIGVIRVGVFGAAGRMGGEVCSAVAGDPELELVAVVDPRFPDVPGPDGVEAGPTPDVMRASGVDVAVDFTVAASALSNACWRGQRPTPSSARADWTWRSPICNRRSPRRRTVDAPNSQSGRPDIRLAEIAAPLFETRRSSSSTTTARPTHPGRRSPTGCGRYRRGRRTRTQWRDSAAPSGGRHPSTRCGCGLVATRRVVPAPWARPDDRHDSYDRTSFMPGVLLAVKRISRARRDRRPRRAPRL
jgi:4-hydroxy-tetrahydrodipicolinate reductase